MQIFPTDTLPEDILNQIFGHFTASKKDVCLLLCLNKKISHFITDFFIKENNKYVFELHKSVNNDKKSFSECCEVFNHLQERIQAFIQVIKNKEGETSKDEVEKMILTQKLMGHWEQMSNQMSKHCEKANLENKTLSYVAYIIS